MFTFILALIVIYFIAGYLLGNINGKKGTEKLIKKLEEIIDEKEEWERELEDKEENYTPEYPHGNSVEPYDIWRDNQLTQ